MVSLTAESGKHAKVSSEDLEGLAQTAKTMSELSTEVENILTTFRDEFEMVKNETGTIDIAAAFTFSHGTCTSCSEVRNQNNQLDYCSRLPGKMQAFFQKILRFFGKPNSFSHRCAMPAVPLLALCATSPGRGSLSQ